MLHTPACCTIFSFVPPKAGRFKQDLYNVLNIYERFIVFFFCCLEVLMRTLVKTCESSSSTIKRNREIKACCDNCKTPKPSSLKLELWKPSSLLINEQLVKCSKSHDLSK